MEYEVKAVPVSISASSKVSVKIKDNFYTLNYQEERSVDLEDESVDIEEERKALWNTVNSEVDKQIEEIYKLFK